MLGDLTHLSTDELKEYRRLMLKSPNALSDLDAVDEELQRRESRLREVLRKELQRRGIPVDHADRPPSFDKKVS
jgi:hypothetical protein